MKPTHLRHSILPAILLALGISLVHGQTSIGLSSTAPTTTVTDIVNFTGTSSQYTDDVTDSTTPSGQTFTTLSALGGYDLLSVTVQGGGVYRNQSPSSLYYFSGQDLTLTIYSVAGSALTPLVSQQFQFTSEPAALPTDYLTFDLTTPIALAASTEYAFTIGNSYVDGVMTNGTYGKSYLSFKDSSPSTSTYSGGAAINGSIPTGSTSATISTTQPYDMNFQVDLKDAPEPSIWAMMLGGIAVLLGLQRFRRRSI